MALRRSDTEILVRDATNNEQWGPSGSDMRQIADLTYSPTDYNEIMTTLWERLEDRGKNWRHVYKGLLVIDYLLKNGSERVVQECKFRSLVIKTLSEFQFIDEDEKDQGLSVRQRAKAIMELINDEKRLNVERQTASKNRDKFGQAISSESGYMQSGIYARGSNRNGGYADRSSSNDRYGSSTGGSPSRAPAADVSSEEEEEEKPVKPVRTRTKKTATTESPATSSQPDLLGFDAFGSQPQQQAQGDFFDPRGTASKPPAQQQQPNFFPQPPANNHIDFFGQSQQPQQPPQQQQFVQPPPQQPQQMPGNPQRLPNGNLLVQGHEITVAQYQQYLQYLQQQNQPQQPQQQQQQQQVPVMSPPPAQRSVAPEDDWNDFTGSSGVSRSAQQPMTAMTPANGGYSSTPASPQQPAPPKDKFDDLLDLSSLSSGGRGTSAAPKNSEPTLAQLQAQRQAQAQQQNGGFNGGFGQPQFGSPQPPQQNGFFF